MDKTIEDRFGRKIPIKNIVKVRIDANRNCALVVWELDKGETKKIFENLGLKFSDTSKISTTSNFYFPTQYDECKIMEYFTKQGVPPSKFTFITKNDR